jgi:hypothetical protein
VVARRCQPVVVASIACGDRQIEAALPSETFNSALLVEPKELKPYRVFTPYYRACLTK